MRWINCIPSSQPHKLQSLIAATKKKVGRSEKLVFQTRQRMERILKILKKETEFNKNKFVNGQGRIHDHKVGIDVHASFLTCKHHGEKARNLCAQTC